VSNKALLDLTNACLAIEGLLRSRVLSTPTRKKLEAALDLLNKEAAKQMGDHLKQKRGEPESKLGLAAD
jgi:hypothetical protein